MYGLNAVKTLGVRIGQELNERITAAAETLKKDLGKHISKSEIARQVLEDFFHNPESLKKSFRDEYKRVAGRTNVKQKRRRKR